MSKKNKNYNRELTVDDRFDLMFGSDEAEDETGEKDWFHNKRDFAEQIARTFGVSDPDDIEEPTSILKPSNIDELEEETESNDSAEDVISMLGIKSDRDKPETVNKERSSAEKPATINTREMAVDKPEIPAIELWLNEKSHVLHFSDGVRRIDMPIDIMDDDRYVVEHGEIPSMEEFEKLYRKLIFSSVPLKVMSEMSFRTQYLYGYTFYKAMPFRFLHVTGDINESDVVIAYALEPNYQYNLMKMYTSLKEIDHVCAAYSILMVLADAGTDYIRIIESTKFHKPNENLARVTQDEINLLYGRSDDMLTDALKNDPVASGEPTEDDMKAVGNLKDSVFIYTTWEDIRFHLNNDDCILAGLEIPGGAPYEENWTDDDEDDEDEYEDEESSSEPTESSMESEEDIPTLAPKDEEERRSIMEAFGQSSDDSEDDEDDEEDSDDSDDEDDDIAKFLKDDDDKDDGDDIMIDVKR